MEKHCCKWKKYYKNDNKKNIVKYFRTDNETNLIIKGQSEKNNLSQSAIIKNAILWFYT